MNKIVKISLAVGAALLVAGFSIADVREYAIVLRNRISQSLRTSIPVSVELDRVELLLREIDSHADQQKLKVASAKVSLQEAEQLLAQASQRRSRMLTSLQQVRNGQAPSSASHRACSLSSGGSRYYDLSYCLNACRQLDAECDARQDAVNHQQTAFDRMCTGFSELESQRKLLAHRLTALRARFDAQQLSSPDRLSSEDSQALAKVTQLADAIERQLKIAETADQLAGNRTTESSRQIDVTDLESEVDSFLNARNDS